MNALIQPTQSGQNDYLGHVYDITTERLVAFHSKVPQHKFLSALMNAGIKGKPTNNNRDAWHVFETHFSKLNLPFGTTPLGITVLEDNDLSYSFKVTQHLRGRLKGYYFEVIVIISNDIQTFLNIGFSDDLESLMTERDWRELATSVGHKKLLMTLAEA